MLSQEEISDTESLSYAGTITAVDTFNVSHLLKLLAKEHNLQILPEERYMEADYLLCDTYHFRYLKHRGVRILVTNENHPADLSQFDYCLTHDTRQSDRRLYFPYYRYRMIADEGEAYNAVQNRPPLTEQELTAQKRKFCSFVCRNAACRKRNRFVRTLSARRRVDCGGPFMNNLGYCVKDKVAFQRDYLFSVAYENEAYPGYLTEKIMDAFLARSIPIYWGDPLVTRHFNPEAFIHARDFRSDAELADYLLRLSEDTPRLLRMLNAPVFRNPNEAADYMAEVRSFFSNIIRLGPGAQRRTRWQKIHAVLQNFYGHGLFRFLRRLSRRLRGKE